MIALSVMNLLLLLLVFVGSSYADRCPTFTTKPYFEIAKYTGLWYEIARIPDFSKNGTKCGTGRYKLNSNGTVTVIDEGINAQGQHISYTGLATVVDPEVPAILKVVFGPYGGGFYNVLATDYDHYSVVYDCSVDPTTGVKAELAFIISRQKTLEPKYLKKAKKVFIDNDVDICKLLPTAQNC